MRAEGKAEMPDILAFEIDLVGIFEGFRIQPASA